MKKTMDSHVIPAKAGIQSRTAGFRVKPGMTESDESFRFMLTDY